MSGDLVAFLRARLDEDEAVARAATAGAWELVRAPDGSWYVDPGDLDDVANVDRTADAEHIARHDPARVLRDVAANRAIVDECERMSQPFPAEWLSPQGQILRALASTYADHPEYREEWKP